MADTLLSSDPSKRVRALHFFGRAVDAAPASASASASSGGSVTLARIPAIHRDDALWLSLLDRVVMGVVACTRVPANCPLPGTPAALALAAAASAATASAPGSAPGPACDPVTVSQTALSVLRKMFRNCAPYCAGKAGSVLAGLFLAMRSAPKELAAVVERTVEEVVERLPCDLALSVRSFV